MFATADWDEPYWTNKQHCAQSLAALGTRVLYVESVGLRSPKAGSAKDWGRLWNRLCKGLASIVLGARERAPGIFVLSPLLIPAGHRRPSTRAINRFLLKTAITLSVARERFVRPLIWTYHPFMLEVAKEMDRQALLYHCVDDLAAVPGVDAEDFRIAERLLLASADVVFATTTTLADHCRQFNPNTHYLSNVVDAEHFGRALVPGPIPSDLASIPEPRLCYHGVISDFKVDLQLLIDVARLQPQWSWVLIGEEREGQNSPLVIELETLPNVHFLGYKPYADLPEYLRGMQVGLLPSLINNYTRGMFPMKYFEYLAAGMPVVSTPLQFTQTQVAGLKIGPNAARFAEAICDQLKLGRFSVTEVAELVGKNTWQERTRFMLNKLSTSL